VLGGPRLKGPTKFRKKGCGITITQNTFNQIIDTFGVWGGWGATITVAWGLTRPKSGPNFKSQNDRGRQKSYILQSRIIYRAVLNLAYRTD